MFRQMPLVDTGDLLAEIQRWMMRNTDGRLPQDSATQREFYWCLSDILIHDYQHSIRVQDTRHGFRHEFDPELVEHVRAAVLKRDLEVAEKHALFRRQVAYDREFKRHEDLCVER